MPNPYEIFRNLFKISQHGYIDDKTRSGSTYASFCDLLLIKVHIHPCRVSSQAKMSKDVVKDVKLGVKITAEVSS